MWKNFKAVTFLANFVASDWTLIILFQLTLILWWEYFKTQNVFVHLGKEVVLTKCNGKFNCLSRFICMHAYFVN